MAHPPEPPAAGGPPDHPSAPPQGSYGPSGTGYPVVTTNAKATASLVIGLVGLTFFWCLGLGLVGVAAVLLGVRARSEIRASGGRQTGEGLALAGAVTGGVAAVLSLLTLAAIALAFVGLIGL